MNKDLTLEAINSARDSHMSQLDKIQALIDGEEITNPTTVSYTKCTFGLWLYDKNNNIENILGENFYQQIEQLHIKWHGEYSRIFDIFFTNRKKGFFAKILGHSNVDEKELDRAKLYYSELQETTQNLLRILASSQRRIAALSETKFV